MPENIDIVSVSLDNDRVAQDGPLAALQIALVDRLEREPHYAPVTLLYENSLDIISDIDIAIASLGICIVILTPEARDESPNVPRPVLDNVRLVAQVIENPLINRAETGARIPGGTIAWRLAKDLSATLVNDSLLVHESIRQVVNEKDGTVVWNVEFNTSLNI